jgi:hypothetical protein
MISWLASLESLASLALLSSLASLSSLVLDSLVRDVDIVAS